MSDLVPTAQLATMFADYNPRTAKAQGMEQLRGGLRKFGVVQDIVCNRRTNRVVSGHRRIEAAQLEGIDALPVTWVDLDDADEMQLSLLLNNSAGEWDDAKLADCLGRLDLAGADLQLTGFSDAELERLLGKFGAKLADLPSDLGPTSRDVQEMTFVLHVDQVPTVKAALDLAAEHVTDEDRALNGNTNACALHALARLVL